MAEVIALGPFMVKTVLLKLVISSVIAMNFVSFFAKRKGIWDGRYLDALFHAIFITIVIWKVSPIVDYFKAVISNPFSLLVLPGTTLGLWVGILVSILYFFMALRKQRLNVWLFLDLAILGVLLSFILFNLLGWRYGNPTAWGWGIMASDETLRYHPINVYAMIVLIPIFLKCIREPNEKFGNGFVASEGLLMLGTGMFAVSLFDANVRIVLGLTVTQWFYIGSAVTGLLLSTVLQRKNIALQKNNSDMETTER